MPRDETPRPPRRARTAGVVLAAGSSARLGANKLLLEYRGEPLVRRSARSALDAGLAPVIVVLGFEAERTAAALEGLPVTLVTNPRHAEGMPGSFHAGIAAVPGDCDAAMIVLPDMPLVGAAAMRETLERFRDTGAPLVITLYGEVPAPPTLYARALFPAALAAREGGREVVRAHRAGAAVVRRSPDLLLDVDRPADLERLRALERLE